jgi:hypothetical protein
VEDRIDAGFAQLMAILCNINRDPKKSKAFSAKDFLPDWDGMREEAERPPPLQRGLSDERKRVAEALLEAFRPLAAKSKDKDRGPVKL